MSRLYLFKLDRLTRSGLVDTVSVVREFQRAGVELVSVTDGFDLTGPAAELIVGVMGWAAEFERQSIAIRTKARAHGSRPKAAHGDARSACRRWRSSARGA